MADDSFILIPGQPQWQIGRAGRSDETIETLDVAPDALPAQLAESVVASLRAKGWRSGKPVALALPSAWCLAASIDTSALPRGDRLAMLYRLEEKLPVAAEDVVADFIAAPDARRTLGVAVLVKRVRPLAEALESAGVPVASISPAALLASQAAADEAGEGAIGNAVLLLGDGAGVNVIRLRDGRPADWSVALAEPGDVELHLRAQSVEFGAPRGAVVCGFDGDGLVTLAGAEVNRRAVSLASLAARAAGRAIAGRARPWVELRRDALAPADRLRAHQRPLHALLAAAAVFLICLSGALMVLAGRYQRDASRSDAALAAEFTRAFPGWPVPTNVRAVIQSEHRKRLEQTVSPADASERAGRGAAAGSALRSLRDVLAALPADARFSLERMTFDENEFELAGRTNYADLGPLVAAARSAGFTIAPPEAHRGDDGSFSFTLHGTRPTSPAIAAASAAPRGGGANP